MSVTENFLQAQKPFHHQLPHTIPESTASPLVALDKEYVIFTSLRF